MAQNYRFQVLGPFRMSVERRSRGMRGIDCQQARDEVFEQAEEACGGKYDVTKAIGCYVFGLSPSGASRIRPYYVGKACDQTLYKRVFQPTDKPGLYDEILNWYEKAAPFVFLLPLLTPSGVLARLGSNGRRISLAEHTLIGMALHANPDLWNIKHRVALESFTVDGTAAASGRLSNAAAAFRSMLDREPPRKVARTESRKLLSPDFAPEPQGATGA
jgi:hypothetical protein